MPKGKRIELRRNNKIIASSSSSDDSIRKSFCGCPVPDPVTCLQPKFGADDDDGIHMLCTYDQCPFVAAKLHPICFSEFENFLVKRLATMGSARGWTEAQRRNNLWEKKGQALVGKKLLLKKRKQKRKRLNNLPQIQFVSKSCAPGDEKRKTSDSAASSCRMRNFSESSNSSYLTNTTIGNFSDNGRFQNNDVFSEAGDANNSSSTRFVPAPFTAIQTRSYASTVKSDVSIEMNVEVPQDSGIRLSMDESQDHYISTLDCVQLSVENLRFKSGIPSSVSAITEFPHLSPIRNNNKRGISNENITNKQLTSTPKIKCANNVGSMFHFTQTNSTSHNIMSSIEMEIDKENHGNNNEGIYRLKDDGWDPFFGKDFNIGERLQYIP